MCKDFDDELPSSLRLREKQKCKKIPCGCRTEGPDFQDQPRRTTVVGIELKDRTSRINFSYPRPARISTAKSAIEVIISPHRVLIVGGKSATQIYIVSQDLVWQGWLARLAGHHSLW